MAYRKNAELLFYWEAINDGGAHSKSRLNRARLFIAYGS